MRFEVLKYKNLFPGIVRFILPLLLLAAWALIYFFIPGFFLKFIIISIPLSFILRTRPGSENYKMILGLSAALSFSFAFILNPVSYYIVPEYFPDSSKVIVFAGLLIVLVGGGWLCLSIGMFRKGIPEKCVEGPVARFGWKDIIVLWGTIMIIYLPSWSQDIPINGDESYHIFSLVLYQKYCICIFKNYLAQIFFFIWIFCVCFIWTFFQASKLRRLLFLLSLFVFLLISLYSITSLYYEGSILSETFSRERSLRYPSAQAWISGVFVFMVNMLKEKQDVLLGLEYMRFLPLLCLFSLGGILLGDRRWRLKPFFAVLAALAVITLPDLYYHGTILYLEFASVVFCVVIFFDSKNVLKSSVGKLRNRWSWAALILLGFAKDTVFPALMLIFFLRLFVRGWYQIKDKRQTWISFLRGEAVLSFCSLFPLLFYIAMRLLFASSARPYGNNFSNIFDLNLIVRMLYSNICQFGFIWIPAIIGLIVLIKRRNFHVLLLTVFAYAGYFAFFVCDSSIWVGLARFNLMLLPSVIVWAWEGFTFLLKKKKNLALILSVCIFALNILLGPVKFSGERLFWGNSDEIWFPYTNCFSYIKESFPGVKKVLFGKMKNQYTFSFVSERVGSLPQLNKVNDSFEKPEVSIFYTLERAKKEKYNIVIYHIYEDNPKLDFKHPSYVPIEYFPGNKGGLLLFVRKP